MHQKQVFLLRKQTKKKQILTYSDTTREFHHLLSLNILQTIDTSNTVTNGNDTASLFELSTSGGAQNALFQDGRNFGSSCIKKTLNN